MKTLQEMTDAERKVVSDWWRAVANTAIGQLVCEHANCEFPASYEQVAWDYRENQPWQKHIESFVASRRAEFA